MCGGGTPTLEQQAQALDRPANPAARGFHRPIPLDVLNAPDAKKLPDNPGDVMQLEPLGQYTISEAYNRISGAYVGMVENVANDWAQIKKAIDDAKDSFQQQLNALEQSAAAAGSQSWTGATHDAALQNLFSSFQTIQTISDSVGSLNSLTQTFAKTIQDTQNAIMPQYFTYQNLLNNPEYQKSRDAIDYAFNRYAQSVLTTTYAPPIVKVANTTPPFPVATPQVGQPGVTPPQSTGGGGAPGLAGGGVAAIGSGGGGVPTVTTGQGPAGGLDTATTPSAPQAPVDPAAAASPASSGASGLQSLSSLPNSAQSLMSPLQSALGQATRAGQRAGNTGALGAPNGPGKLPKEGALALGKGVKGGAGRIGGGAGARGPSIGKAAGVPSTGASTIAARTAAAGFRAGLTGTAGGAGVGGAGAPAAGHNGGAGAHGAQHQPNKALRRKKNGEELIGSAEAVVAVLGEPARTEPAKPDGT